MFFLLFPSHLKNCDLPNKPPLKLFFSPFGNGFHPTSKSKSFERLDPGMSFLATTELRCWAADMFGEDVPPVPKGAHPLGVFYFGALDSLRYVNWCTASCFGFVSFWLLFVWVCDVLVVLKFGGGGVSLVLVEILTSQCLHVLHTLGCLFRSYHQDEQRFSIVSWLATNPPQRTPPPEIRPS